MSKNIRKIIAAIFAIGSLSIIEPNYLNLTTTKVYAEEKPYLKSLYLSEGDDIPFTSDTNFYIVDVDKDTEELFVKAKAEDPLDTVEINGKPATKENYYRQTLPLEKGKNTIKIEIQDDKTQEKTFYYVYVYRGGKNAVYLDDIRINDSTIGFDKTTNSYNIELDEGTNMVKLYTVPEQGNYTISANGTELNNTNSIKLKFKGINKYPVNITVKDEDTEREGKYTLNIYLGIPVAPNAEESIKELYKPNQWVLVNGRWRYNDALGKPLTNTWFYDQKYKSYFHFNSRGNMQTWWIEVGDKEYYLNPSGQMQTGWILDEGQWYYLGTDGAMKTGWVQINGKWYSLRKNGTMATGWIISNDKWYYLNSNGVMQTGWLYYDRKWYYLDNGGTMQTGWIKDKDQWYYLNSNGTMKSGEWFFYNNNWYYLNYNGNMRCGLFQDKDDRVYYFNEDGTMRTSPITIEGYTYKVNVDGSISNVVVKSN